jgi:two-component system nitrate/nitrite response regulator NarL
MEEARRIKVVLVDDHQIVLDGLVSIIGSDPDFLVLAALNSGEALLDFFKKSQPDILLTDYNLPGISGLELTRIVKRNYPTMKVVMLSMHDEVHVIKNILKEGVDGYLLKNIQQFELKNALKRVMNGVPYVSPEITKVMLQEINNPSHEAELLTDREKEILRLITQEYANKQIATKLFISERTVETHRKNIFRKTNSSSLVGLIKYAFENKLV